MDGNFEKLNRLRVNAGKNALKTWKASAESMQAQIKKFEDEGFTDALPGGNIEVVPQTSDPAIIAALTPKEKVKDDVPSLADSAMGKMATPAPAEPEKVATRGRASLARGLDTDIMATQSRMAVQMARSKEKREKKAIDDAAKPKEAKVKLSKADKKQIKDEQKAREARGEVNAKKDPEKAARQQQHIKDKQAARAAKPKVEKDDKLITVADLARELDVDPKVARAKLRRYEGKAEYPKTVAGERWTFPKSAKDALSKILSSK